jgi:DNA-binding response OmpR family regulator
LDPSTIRILVADDDRMIRRIVVTKLSGLGYVVEEAEDGQAALERLGDGATPDLLITDQLMPRMDGLQLVRKIRASENSSIAALPIIMLTSKSQEQDVIEGFKVGMDDYVSKPFSPDELAARVGAVLWRARRMRG